MIAKSSLEKIIFHTESTEKVSPLPFLLLSQIARESLTLKYHGQGREFVLRHSAAFTVCITQLSPRRTVFFPFQEYGIAFALNYAIASEFHSAQVNFFLTLGTSRVTINRNFSANLIDWLLRYSQQTKKNRRFAGMSFTCMGSNRPLLIRCF